MRKLKIIIVGSQGSGKTAISNYLYNPDGYIESIYRPTVGVRIWKFEKRVKHSTNTQGETCLIELWDISGDIAYENSWKAIRRNTDGVVFVTNSDRPFQEKEYAYWIQNFAKDIKIKPNRCLAFSHSISEKQNENAVKSFKGLQFLSSSIKTGSLSICSVFDTYLFRLVNELNKLNN